MIKSFYTRILLALLLLGSGVSFSQKSTEPEVYTSSDKKALKLFAEGRHLIELRKDKDAEEALLKAVKVDPKFVEPHMVLAALYGFQKRMKEREEQLKLAVQKGPNIYPENHFNLAEWYFYVGNYQGAKSMYEVFLKLPRVKPENQKDAEFHLKCSVFAIDAIIHPKNVSFTNMGPAVNSAENEYFPTITADEQFFYYTRQLECRACPSGIQEDLFLAKAQSTAWAPSKVVRELGSTGNEGAPSISADGNYMFITMSSDIDGMYMGGQIKGYGSCDIFYTQKINGRWMKPMNLGTSVNSSAWESQPSFSSDGKTLYFVRGFPQRNGVVSGIDIYFSEVGADGKFGKAQRLPATINSNLDEQSVFIHPDNQTLYFSSEGHVGMGGADIFMARRAADGTWGEPINLGYPINTSGEEGSLLVSPSGRKAYFASDREGGIGGLDLYEFDLPNELKPQIITYVKGTVYNAKTKEPLEAGFELIDPQTRQVVTQSFSQKNGEFLVTLTSGKNYVVNVNKNGFLFYSDNFNLKEITADFNRPFQLDIPLTPIDTGSTVELKNVFFDVNKAELKPESRAELDKLVSFLTQNENLKIELGGHTDNTGDKKNNQLLSENRAKAVFSYLVNEGKIAANRLSYKGYGDTQPKVANDTPENKAKNRRTEFKVTAK
jgi:outer membrane protein OmpA-like peptidoglycan-associated protein